MQNIALMNRQMKLFCLADLQDHIKCYAWKMGELYPITLAKKNVELLHCYGIRKKNHEKNAGSQRETQN